MDPIILILRVVHILLGVFWAGAVFVIVGFVSPAIGDAGPDGAKVMGALVKRRFLNIVPAAGFATIVSGFWLLSRDSSGFETSWMGSRTGMAFSTGAVFALVALVIGVAVMRRSIMRAMAIGQSLPQVAEGPAREAAMAQMQQLRGRAIAAGRVVAGLLTVTVVAMALARYL